MAHMPMTVGAGCIALSGCGDWTVLQTLDSEISPDNEVYSHSLRMGAGGAAGSTETRIVLTQTKAVQDVLPADAVTVLRTGFGCNEMMWSDTRSLEIRHCTTRSETNSAETVNFNGKNIGVAVKYAKNCDPNAFSYPTSNEKLKRICEKMTYTK